MDINKNKLVNNLGVQNIEMWTEIYGHLGFYERETKTVIKNMPIEI